MTTSHAAWGPPCRPPHPLLFPTAFILRPRLCNRQRKSSARGVPSATLMKSTLVISNYCSHEAHQMFLGGLSLTALLPPLPIPSFSLSRRSADLLHPSRSTKVFELPICRRGPLLSPSARRLLVLGSFSSASERFGKEQQRDHVSALSLLSTFTGSMRW